MVEDCIAHVTCDMFGHVDMLRVIVLRGVFTFVVVTNINYETVCARLGCEKILRDILGTVLFGTCWYFL